MKKFKIFLGILALSLGLLFTLNVSTNTASAATWYAGTPKNIRGYWKSHEQMKSFRGNRWEAGWYMAIYKRSILAGAAQSDAYSTKIVSHQNLRHHVYKLAYHLTMGTPKEQRKTRFMYIKKVSKNKIISDYGSKDAPVYTRGKLVGNNY